MGRQAFVLRGIRMLNLGLEMIGRLASHLLLEC